MPSCKLSEVRTGEYVEFVQGYPSFVRIIVFVVLKYTSWAKLSQILEKLAQK